jgi:hypothetical protein
MTRERRSLWFGFLEAGDKCSPVVRDGALETGSPETIYLFNLKKGRILEYRRDIVEPKLRELSAEELAMVTELQEAFERARTGFTPRAARRTASPPRQRIKLPEVEIPDFDPDEPPPLLDDDRDEPVQADQLE